MIQRLLFYYELCRCALHPVSLDTKPASWWRTDPAPQPKMQRAPQGSLHVPDRLALAQQS
jgi:hypothetical protein